jgi:hypothetical protein
MSYPCIYRLMQLSKIKTNKFVFRELVEVNGFEPMTSCLQGRRSPN